MQAATVFDFPAPDAEAGIVSRESGLPKDRCVPLVRVANALRDLKGQDLEEGASTRLVVYCATLIRDGVKPGIAIQAALIEPLTDDPDVKGGLLRVAEIALG